MAGDDMAVLVETVVPIDADQPHPVSGIEYTAYAVQGIPMLLVEGDGFIQRAPRHRVVCFSVVACVGINRGFRQFLLADRLPPTYKPFSFAQLIGHVGQLRYV